MIDLSYLTEEEQEAIMTVLKRDADLKKAEEDRVKHLQKLNHEDGTLKYVTGEWFYEVKSKRHEDRIHGSDIIMASMKQKKPMTVEFLTQSWRERPSKSISNIMLPKPESMDSLKQSGSPEAPNNRQNFAIRSPSRVRHNPFNMLPMDPNFDLINDSAEPQDKDASVTGVQVFQNLQESSGKTNIPDTPETTPSQKPVPKKRTKLYKPQNSVAESSSSVSIQSTSTISSSTSPASTQSVSVGSDSMSTVSTPSMSMNSGVSSSPMKGILKHDVSSTDRFKSRLPQPLKPLESVSTTSAPKHVPEENTQFQNITVESNQQVQPQKPMRDLSSVEPRSLLPVRTQLSLDNPGQMEQKSPRLKTSPQPRLSRQTNVECKTDDAPRPFVQKNFENSNINVSTSPVSPKQNKSNDATENSSFIPRIRARSALEALLDKPLEENSNIQSSSNNLEKAHSKMSKNENKDTIKQDDHLQNTVEHLGYESLITANASSKGNSQPVYESSPGKHTPNTTAPNQFKTDDYKMAVPENTPSPKPSEEQGDSIAKVLEWFSKSTDSSDILDYEDTKNNVENESRIEEDDCEDAINLVPKPENNVYLVIQSQRGENDAKRMDSFTDTELTKVLSVGKPELPSTPKGIIHLPLNTSSVLESPFSPQNTGPNKKTPGEFRLKKENSDRTESTDSKTTRHELRVEESHPPKIANLKSFWEKGTSEAPRILVGKPNVTQNNGKQEMDSKKKPSNGNVTTMLPTKKERLRQTSKHDDDTITHLSKQELAIKNLKDNQTSVANNNQIQPVMTMNPTSDTDVTAVRPQKTSSTLVDKRGFVKSQSSDNVERHKDFDSPEERRQTRELNSRTKIKENEPDITISNPSFDISHQMSPSSITKQIGQQEDDRAVKIKELKSFWEKENWQPRTYVKSSKPKPASAKLTKRFTKSEYDLTSIGPEYEEEPSYSSNYTNLPLRERMERLVTAEVSKIFEL